MQGSQLEASYGMHKFEWLLGGTLVLAIMAGCETSTSSPEAPAPDPSPVDAGAPLDAATPMSDAAVPPTNGNDAGAQCAPVQVSPLSLAFHGPNAPSPACDDASIHALATACFGAGASVASCAAARAAAPASCASCAFTNEDAASWGPVIVHEKTGGWYELDTGGCIALVQNDTTLTGCGFRWQYDMECSEQVCLVACAPPTTPAAAALFQQCITLAGEDPERCKSYRESVDNCSSANAAVCSSAFYPSTALMAERYMNMFCGGGAALPDAGDPTDAGTD